MSRSLTRRTFGVSIIGLAASCVPAQMAEFMRIQRESNLATQRDIANLKEEQQRLAIQLENSERDRFAEKYCRAGKNSEFNARVTEFIREVEAGAPGACAQGPLQDALYFIGTQPYCNAYFRPNERISDIRPARKGQLARLIDPRYIHPSTRFLVLVQPEQETEAAQSKALKFGEGFKTLIQELATGSNVRILGPHLLPCRLRSEVSRRFHNPMDVTLPDEPAEGTPRLRIWCFRTDCA